MIKNSDRKVYFCECADHRHHIIIDETFLEEDGTILFMMNMNDHPSFFDRVIEAFKYIFRMSTEYSHYGEVIVDVKNNRLLSEDEFWSRIKTAVIDETE